MIRSTLSFSILSLIAVQGAIAQTFQPPITDLAFPSQPGQIQSSPYNPSIGAPYRVLIDSSDPLVLQQVKRIEPKAFFQVFSGNRVLIQTGLFSTEYAARQQMALLERSGYRPLIIGGTQSPNPGTPNTPNPLPPSTALGKGYYTIVPVDVETERDVLNKIISAGISGDQIQLRSQPFGRHLLIGPWSKRQGAEDMVRFLKEQTRVDARSYYQR